MEITLHLTETFDWATDADGPAYLNVAPREAVMSAYARSVDLDVAPALLEALWGHLVVETPSVVRCGSFTAFKGVSGA